MQAVILAAGKSTRTYPLTLTKPKPLLKVANKAILEHNLEAIKDVADEIILVLGFKKNLIKGFIKKNYSKLRIIFIEQKKQLGTGHAVSILSGQIKNKFILMLGDNIYSRKDVKKISKHQYAILVKKTKNWQNFGVIKEKNNIVIDIVEKPKEFISDLISCGLFLLDTKIFDLLKDVKKSERGEYELTDALKLLISRDKLQCINSTSCLQISHPWDLLTADQEIRKNKSIIGKNSKIYGNVKNSSIGENCIISGSVKDSIIMDNTIIDKNSIIEDSIIGENVYFKGIAKSSRNVESVIKGKRMLVDKLGAIIGDNVEAEDVEIKSGCKIWSNKKISGEINHDIE